MGPVLDLSNRSQSASNRVCWITYGILKIGDQRLVREIGRMSPKIQKIAPQRFRSVSLTRGNVAPIFANRTSPLGTGLVGWGARTRTWEWRNQNPLPYHLATPQFRNRPLGGRTIAAPRGTINAADQALGGP